MNKTIYGWNIKRECPTILVSFGDGTYGDQSGIPLFDQSLVREMTKEEIKTWKVSKSHGVTCFRKKTTDEMEQSNAGLLLIILFSLSIILLYAHH